MDISIVIPVYNAVDSLKELSLRLKETLEKEKLSFEIIFVDDGSKNPLVWETLLRLKEEYSFIRILRLWRNYGQHNAVLAGFEEVSGDVVITMDDDLQHPPEEIPELLSCLNKGYDLVYGVYRDTAEHSFFRSITSVMLQKMLLFTMPDLDPRYSPFRAIRREVVREVLPFVSSNTFIDGYFSWISDNIGAVEVRHNPRKFGKSNYTISRLISHTINVFVSFSSFPLRLASSFGLLFSAIGGLLALYIIARKLIYGSQVLMGYSSLMVGILLSAGILLLMLGILGEYIASINMKVLKKPKYLVKERK